MKEIVGEGQAPKYKVELDGGYAVLKDCGERGWTMSVYTNWDPWVPKYCCSGFGDRNEAFEAIDEIVYEDGLDQTPRERVAVYRQVLFANCASRGIPVPDPLPRLY